MHIGYFLTTMIYNYTLFPNFILCFCYVEIEAFNHRGSFPVIPTIVLFSFLVLKVSWIYKLANRAMHFLILLQ